MAKRILVAVGVALATLLGVEGLLSLLGRGTFGSALRGERIVWREPADEERFAAAARTPGFYRLHPDPLVGYVLKAEGEFDILGGRGRADELGLRVRPGGEGAPVWEDPGVLRVVVLGDSVAFGYGLADADVLAARLEAVLNQARGPGARPVACRTVALPGWTYRNQFAFLRDHWDELRCELVVHVPIENDVASPRGVNESGQFATGYDLAEEDPWLVASLDLLQGLKDFVFRRTGTGAALPTRRELGLEALTADLTRESSRRFDAMAEAVVELEAFLAAEDCRLALLQYDRPAAIAILFDRLHRLGLGAPIAPFLVRVEKAQTLEIDPHPSARTIQDCAIVLARFLLERGLLERGADRPLPPLSEGLAERLAPVPTPELCAELAAARRAEALEELRPSIDWRNGQGVLQVIGNVGPRGLVGTRLLAVVQGTKALRITLEALPERPDLYPLELTVEIDRERREPLRLEAGGRVERVFPLALAAPRPVEVRLVPERWTVVRHERRSVLASCQLVALEALE